MLWSDHDFEQYTQFIVHSDTSIQTHTDKKRYLLIIIFFFSLVFLPKNQKQTTRTKQQTITVIIFLFCCCWVVVFLCCPDLTCTWFVWTWLTPLVYFIYLVFFLCVCRLFSSLVNSFYKYILGGCCYRYSNVNKINKKRNKRFFLLYLGWWS